MSIPSFPTPQPSNPDFVSSVRAVFAALACEDSTGEKRVNRSAEGLCPDAWSAVFQLDGINEVLEWNNEGISADEIACLWLAQLRMLRSVHGISADSVPFAPNRELDDELVHSATVAADSATLAALSEPEMQRLEKNINAELDAASPLVRALVLGFLPVEDAATVAVLAARSTALTHSHPNTVWSAITLALVMRHLLALKTSSQNKAEKNLFAEALKTTRIWLETSAPPQIPGTAHQVIQVLQQALQQSGHWDETPPGESARLAPVESALKTLTDSLSFALHSSSNVEEKQSQTPEVADRSRLIATALTAVASPSHNRNTLLPAVALVVDNFCAQLGLNSPA